MSQTDVLKKKGLDPYRVQKLGKALPYGGLKKIERDLEKPFHEVRDTFNKIQPDGYDLQIIQAAMDIYNSSRLTGEQITLEDLEPGD